MSARRGGPGGPASPSGCWSWERAETACRDLLESLDWGVLGKLYFETDGERALRELVPRVLLLGMDWARALLRRLPATGRSLHVGAGVAELPVLLCERLVRGREVAACNMRRRECEVLAEGLRRAGLSRVLEIAPLDAAAVAPDGGYDHLGCVSVFTDPETWPVLSGVAYGRMHPTQLDVGAFTEERDRARQLAAGLVAGLDRPGWITTTVEEVGWFAEQVGAAGGELLADEETVASAVVGDAIGFLRCR